MNTVASKSFRCFRFALILVISLAFLPIILFVSIVAVLVTFVGIVIDSTSWGELVELTVESCQDVKDNLVDFWGWITLNDTDSREGSNYE